MPDYPIPVTEACNKATADCSTLTADTCETTLDVGKTGMVDEMADYCIERDCVTEMMATDEAVTCDEAFTSCAAAYF
jgi:hypothetical protein